MQLPIAKFSSADMLRVAQRCRMDLASAIADPFSADGVFAYILPKFPALPAANCVELSSPLVAGQIERIDAEFADRGGRCLRWMSPQLEQELIDRDAVACEWVVQRISQWTNLAEPSDAMILQARAAPAKCESLLCDAGLTETEVLAAMEHVDDPHDEWLIEVQAGQAVAANAILTSGDAGLLHHLIALPGQ